MDKIEQTVSYALTFDDVLLVPQYSTVQSRNDIDLRTKFSRNVPLNIPITSSCMDTVTEVDMAIEMARNGGIGILHRFNSIEEQCQMLQAVKRAESYIIREPYTIHEESSMKDVWELQQKLHVNTFLVTEHNQNFEVADHSLKHKLVGILTERDCRKATSGNQKVKELMTSREKLTISQNNNISDLEAKKLMINAGVEKLPLVSEKNEITGLVTLRDILVREKRPLANIDSNGKLYVGCAVGAKDDYLERAKKLIDFGTDVVVVDIANGHSTVAINAVERLKEQFEIDVVAGSIATGDGAERLIKAGADGIRCGIGSGSICTTRLVAGAGVPQLSAIFDCAKVCHEAGVPLISDGGNRHSGNMCKALGAGADCVMVGRLVAGCDESPGNVLLKDGKRVKIYRGMAGYGANLSKAQRMNSTEPNTKKFIPEGVEGFIPYIGPLSEVLAQFTGGIKSGMSYTGSYTIKEHHEKAKFIRLTQSAIFESGVHDISKIK